VSKITLSKFWDILNQFDWFYHKGLDFDFDEGSDVEVFEDARTEALTGLGAEYAGLYAQFRAHKYGGAPFGKPEVAKPPRPTE